ncbi:MAG: cytochrome c oxidase subunit II [Amylibacter sp.]|jgi:cytochrome c oxidase subunit 2|tara:strand:- start:1802 stop:2656 length:855 start_codon:yes stop_codon:yes gene_type:complete
MARQKGISMGVALAIVIIVIGSVLFHLFSPWWWTPIATNWGFMDDMISLTFWITGIVYVVILLFVAYCVYKFQYREGRVAAYEPENTKLEIWLTVLTSVGVVALLAPGLFVWFQFVNVPEEATEVEVVGQQWFWSFRLPGADGKLGTADNRLISEDNILGINPNDPYGQDDIIIDGNDLHLAAGQPVKMLLRSVDVLHNFYVPEFRAKMDMVPGMITYFWMEPTRVGTYDVLCAELCGVGHGYMGGTVLIDKVEDYDLWISEQTTFAEMTTNTGIEFTNLVEDP